MAASFSFSAVRIATSSRTYIFSWDGGVAAPVSFRLLDDFLADAKRWSFSFNSFRKRLTLSFKCTTSLAPRRTASLKVTLLRLAGAKPVLRGKFTFSRTNAQPLRVGDVGAGGMASFWSSRTLALCIRRCSGRPVGVWGLELLTRADNGIFAVGTFCRLEITDLARAILTAFSSLDDIEPLEFFVAPAALLARRCKGSFGTKDMLLVCGCRL